MFVVKMSRSFAQFFFLYSCTFSLEPVHSLKNLKAISKIQVSSQKHFNIISPPINIENLGLQQLAAYKIIDFQTYPLTGVLGSDLI